MIIGICDDDKIWERKASYIIGEYRKKASLDIDIQYFPHTFAVTFSIT